jgi:hypothetical protein
MPGGTISLSEFSEDALFPRDLAPIVGARDLSRPRGVEKIFALDGRSFFYKFTEMGFFKNRF